LRALASQEVPPYGRAHFPAPYVERDPDHVLLPVGQAATDESNDVVWVHAMNSEDFKDIPEYEHGSRVEPAFERETTSAYDQRTRGRRYHRPEYGAMDIGS
jgi:hypothetical protein